MDKTYIRYTFIYQVQKHGCRIMQRNFGFFVFFQRSGPSLLLMWRCNSRRNSETGKSSNNTDGLFYNNPTIWGRGGDPVREVPSPQQTSTHLPSAGRSLACPLTLYKKNSQEHQSTQQAECLLLETIER